MLIANIRTVLFYLVSVPFTMSWAAMFCFFAYLIPYPTRYHVVIGGWAKVMHVLSIVLLGIRVRVHGRENIPDGACVVMSNHQSAWETYFMQLLFKPQAQVAKASLLKIPVFGWTFGMMKPIAIDRANRRQAMSQVIEQGSARIAEGSSVLIFPEGTRSKPNKPLPFRKGGAVLAKAAGCSIVPVTHNSGHFWSNERFAKHAGVIDLYVHPAISTVDRSAEDLISEVEEVVIGRLKDLESESGGDVTSDSEEATA
jgi:1-acyl-sn-glycerol-3-phosphate acyltransferase